MTVHVSRPEFLEFVAGLERGSSKHRNSASRTPRTPPEAGSLYLFWFDEGALPRERDWPDAVIVKNEEYVDFLAWVNSYLTGFCPLTALTRVLDWRSFELLRERKEPGFSSAEAIPACAALGGAILGEFVMAADNRVPVEQAPIQAFTATATYVLAKCLSSNCEPEEIAIALFKWANLRQRFRTKDQGDSSPDFSINAIAAAIIGKDVLATKPNTGIFLQNHLYLQQLATQLLSGMAAPILLGQISEGILDWTLVNELSNKSREDRVAWVDSMVKAASFSKLEAPIRAFILGYSVSLISEGSFEHYGYLSKLAEKNREALVWYGFCVGTHKSRRILSTFGGLARRILRELDNHWFPGDQRPQSDISFEELMLIARNLDSVPEIRRFSKNSLRIELVPGVSTYIRVPVDDSSEDRGDSEALLRCLDELGWGLDRIRNTTHKMFEIVGDRKARPRRKAK